MKTVYVTNLGDASLVDPVLANFKAKNGHLPPAVQEDKLYQAMKQILLLTYEGDGYGFYETSLDEGRQLLVSDPVGAMAVRIDYDPNFIVDEENPSEELLLANVFDMAVMALNQPNSHPHNPENAAISCIRVQAKVAYNTILVRTYWPTQFDLVPGLIGPQSDPTK